MFFFQLDATAFGHLSQFWFTTSEAPKVKDYLSSDCQNLVNYIKRIQAAYWPDWQEITEKHTMDSTAWKEMKKGDVKEGV